MLDEGVDRVMIVALALLGVGLLLILFGMYLFLKGVSRLSDRPIEEGVTTEAKRSVTDRLLEYMTKCIAIMLDPKASPPDRQMAAGTFYILLGVLFLLSGAVTGAIGGIAGGGGV